MSAPAVSRNSTRNSTHVIAQGLVALPALHSRPVVFVVDEDASVRESLERLISCHGWQPVTFASAHAFLRRPRGVVPNCLVLDVSPSDISGLDLQKRVAIERPDLPIIFIASRFDVRTTVQAMKAGAVEFFTKPFRDDVLVSTIREAIERNRNALGYEAEMQMLRDCYTSLSPRERQVMRLVVSGLLNKQVGGELGISERTVKAHRGQVMQKMKADSLADLVKIAVRLELAPTINPWRMARDVD